MHFWGICKRKKRGSWRLSQEYSWSFPEDTKMITKWGIIISYLPAVFFLLRLKMRTKNSFLHVSSPLLICTIKENTVYYTKSCILWILILLPFAQKTKSIPSLWKYFLANSFFMTQPRKIGDFFQDARLFVSLWLLMPWYTNHPRKISEFL